LRADFAGAPLGEQIERLRAALRKQHHDLTRRVRIVERREQELDLLRERVARHAAAKRFIVRSRPMRDVLEQAARVAPLDMTVLIAGESGTGKEFVVRMIHEHSARRRGSLVSVNCAALTETLLESELFGHVRGAFTGAVREKPGLFESASHGTLFLDEVGEMSPALQAKLLRALQEGEIRRVGGERTIKVAPRVIAASNRDLRAAIKAGTFREDLYFRLGAFVITVPPLRERREAIPALVHEFCSRAAKRFGKDVPAIAPPALTRLVNYRWPGNVRELEHAVERAVVLTDAGVIQMAHLPLEITAGPERCLEDDTLDLRRHERALIQQALEKFPHSRRRAAAALRISTVTLWRKMKEYGLLITTSPHISI
jgi:transcriptional regulator with PAS, ATPase and Fis domain